MFKFDKKQIREEKKMRNLNHIILMKARKHYLQVKINVVRGDWSWSFESNVSRG